MPGARTADDEIRRLSSRRLGGPLSVIALLAVALQAGCGSQDHEASIPSKSGIRRLHVRLEELPPDTEARQAAVLDRVSELPSREALGALAHGGRSVVAFSALTAGTVVLRWRVGPGGGRIVAESRRHYDGPLRGARARLTLSPAGGAQRWLDRLGNRLPTSPVAAFVEFRPAHGEAGFSEAKTVGQRRADNSNVEVIAGASSERRP
jgi:hypothetical protein